MTPQERDLITQLLSRLRQAGGQPKDPEADALIRQALAEQPDASYYLVQTVLIQDMALSNAQSRIRELEQQLAACRPAASQPTSFLGGLLGGGSSAPAGGGSVPQSGPWSRPAPGSAPGPQSAPPQWQNPGQPQQPQPMMGQPMMGGGMPMMASGGSGFLRQAAATAAGIAGGALLFEGIQSMFGPHASGILSGASMQPGLSETVINNYYGSDPAGGSDNPQQTAWDQQGNDPGASDPDYVADNDPGPGQDFASDQDFGGDFGGDSDTV
jgi:hypothetical protein